ncbi:MAG: sirohydrochlorin chelatase [Cephaloticoccus sp.]
MKLLLVDNGSLEPAATLSLRDLARSLGARIEREVLPVSLLHANRVPAAALDGEPAVIVEDFLRTELAAGETDFVVLPLFLGPSRAITDYLPGIVAKLQPEFPTLSLRIAPVLHRAGEADLPRMLADRVREVATPDFVRGEPVRVALVDHGSPIPTVTAVRNEVAVQLAHELGETVAAVAPCSMERRPGPEYAFNDPLLGNLLARDPWSSGPVVVTQLFLQPGRHAGEGGDLAQISATAMAASPALRVVRTTPLASHPGLIDLLARRFMDVTAAD